MEFNNLDFHYGMPYFVVHFVDSLIGSKIMNEVSECYKEKRFYEIICPKDEEFTQLRGDLDNFTFDLIVLNSVLLMAY